MRPVDPRLLTRIASSRPLLTVLAGIQAAGAVLVLLQALLIARLLAPALSPGPLTSDGLGALGHLVPVSARALGVGLPLLGAVVAVRALLAWAAEIVADRAGSRAVSTLRSAVVAHVGSLGPRWAASGRSAEVAVVATRGLDGLLPYFSRYLPSLLTAAFVTPVAVVAVLGLDTTSALLILGTLPLVPLFMWLIGRVTETNARRHLDAMLRLGAQTLDLVAGLPTLKALGRSRGPAARIRELGQAHRLAALGTLRVAFLSGMVLELLTTLSVALVAVSMGFRLAGGGITIETALAVLVIAPEAYLPLRSIGTHFHASSDGLAAAGAAFALLDVPSPEARGGGPAPTLRGASIALEGVSVATPEGAVFAPSRLGAVAQPGAILALVGPNGEGKSTTLLVLAGLVPPDEGRVVMRADGRKTLLADSSGAGVDPEGWTSQCAWVPQRPDLGPESLTLSLGQRERLAVARACASGRPLVLLDEPTAHLDEASRLEVVAEMRRVASTGAAVVVATHDPAVAAAADRVVEVVASAATHGARGRA